MSNIKLILTENKSSPYRKQRVVGRLGDGGLTTIDVELLKSDGKTPYSVFSNHDLIFVGTNAKGEYTDGVPEILDGQKGMIRYTFTKDNFSVLKEFKRAYFQLTDADGNRITFQDFTVDVLNNSDIDQGQVTLYVRLLDQLLSDFEKRFGDQSIDFEERFKVFLQAKESQYQSIYQMYNDLVIKLNNLSKDAKSLQEVQAEILKSIEEHDVFTKQESSANVINQIIGKEKVQITFRTDFTDKIAGTDERIHRAWVKEYATVTAPSEWITKIPDNQMGKIESLDNDAYTIAGATNLNICQIGQEYNLVIVLTQLLGEQFFIDRGATSQAQKIEVIKLITKRIESAVWGSGSGVGGYKLTMNRASNISGDFSSWISASSHQDSTNSKVSATLQTAGQFETAFDSNGWFKQVVYANQSDGTTKSQVFVDYACMDITIEISANEHIKSMIAANHVENLATQDEAETGEDNTKTMTPLRVFQSIAQWTKNKFVSKTEDETVLGAKNFKNGLQINGRNVLSQSGEKVVDHTSATDSSIQSGTVRLIRYGDFLIFNFNFQCRSSNINSGGNLIGAIEPDFIPAYSIQVSLNDNKSLTIDSSGKVTALWGLDANKYYVGSAMVIAKNKL